MANFAEHTKTLLAMFTNEDYERLLVKYTSQGIPAGESIQHFCDRMKVPYNLFDKWYRDTRHKIVKVKVDGIPDADSCEGSKDGIMASLVEECLKARQPMTDSTGQQSVKEYRKTEQAVADTTVRIMIDLRTTSGLQIRRKGMTYPEFMDFATKLSALC